MAISSWLHATVYKFTVAGRREMIGLYDAVMQDPGVRCRFLKDQDLFEIECPDHLGDGPYTHFAEICARYVEQKLREKHTTKVFRVIESEEQQAYDFIYEEYERLMAGIEEASDDGALVDVSYDESGEDDSGYAWNPKHQDTDVQKLFEDSILDTVAQDSGCYLKIDPEKRSIIIHGLNYLTAARKLFNIERNARRSKVAAHVINTEKLISVTIQLPRLFDQPYNILLRTLVPNEQFNLRAFLPQARTCRMVRNLSISFNQTQNTETPGRLLEHWKSLSFPRSVLTTPTMASTMKPKRKTRFDVEPNGALASSALDVPPTAQPSATDAPRDLMALDEPPKPNVFVGDLKWDKNALPVPDATPLEKKDAISQWASKVIPGSSGEDSLADTSSEKAPSQSNQPLKKTKRTALNAALSISTPTVAIARATTTAPWAAVASGKRENRAPASCSMVPPEQFPALPGSRLPTPHASTPTVPSQPSSPSRIPSPGLLVGKSVQSGNSSTRAATNVYRERPMRYEETNFAPQQAWETKLVGPHPPTSEIIDVSESTTQGKPPDISAFPPLGWLDSLRKRKPVVQRTEPLISMDEDEDLAKEKASPLLASDDNLLIDLSEIEGDAQAISNHGFLRPLPPDTVFETLIPSMPSEALVSHTPSESLTLSLPSLCLAPQEQVALPSSGKNEEDEEEDDYERVQKIAEPETRKFFTTGLQQKGNKKRKKKPSARTAFPASTTSTPLASNVFSTPLAQSEPSLPLPEPVVERPFLSHPISTQATGTSQKSVITGRYEKKTMLDEHEQELPSQDSMLRIVEHARAFKGLLDMEIQLGQILIHSVKAGEPKDFAKRSMKMEDFEAGLEKHVAVDELKIHFSRRLTTDVSEACHIAVPHLWEQEPYQKEAFYELVVRDKDNNELEVKVTGDPDQTTIKTPFQEIGHVYSHFPRRMWDAKFLVIGRSNDYEIPKAIDELVKSMKIFVETEELNGVSFEVPRVKYRVESNEVAVSSFCSKRSLHHHSTRQPGISLEVTEVRQYQLKGSRIDPSAKCAESGFPEVMVEQHLLWFEATIHIARKPLLEQNLEIQFGDDAAWKVEDIVSQEELATLKAITEQFVTRLDGVGLSNRGPRGDPQDLKEVARGEKEKRDAITGANQSFW